jgi:(p)ppGpp synthase/HD superfamily hydrolase
MNDLFETKHPPCYELFLAPLAVEFDPTTFERVSYAYISSRYGHANEVRDDGTRYFDHPKGAAWIYVHELNGRNPRVIIVTLLHDIVENTRLLSLYRITLNFDKEIALDIRAITKLPKGKETINEYLRRVTDRGPEAILAKLLDNLHNLRTLRGCTPEKQARQLEEFKDILIPTLIPALQAHGGEWSYYANIIEEKMNVVIATYA